MANIKTELSVEVIYRIARMLNTEIESNGQIQLNNKKIWEGFLHQMPNEVWRGVLETLALLNYQHPELFEYNHVTAIELGLGALDKYDSYYDNVLDMRNRHLDHKKIAWKCLMTTREVYNRCCDIYLPNSDVSKVKTTFSSIFE
jgi:hypothetical protein